MTEEGSLRQREMVLDGAAGRERALLLLIKTSAAIVVISIVAFPSPRPAVAWELHSAYLIILGVAFALLKMDRREAAGAVVSLGFWVVASLAVFAFGGARSPSLFVFLPVVLAAGIFWSRRAVTALAIASAVVVFVAVKLDALGVLPEPMAPPVEQRTWIIFAASLLVTAILMTLELRQTAAIRSELARSAALSDAFEARLEQAERLDSIGRVAGGVAHDFNNLLTVILSSAALLERQLGPKSSGAKLTKEITEAGTRAATLARRLLDLARLGRRATGRATVSDLNDVLSEMTRIVERLAGDERTVRVSVGARLATVKVDRTELEQIILNLAANARDATERGGHVTLRTSDFEPLPVSQEVPEGYVRLAVEDDGAGMTKETQARVFEPFFTTKDDGTGLGLSTVLDIVRRSQGHVSVDSVKGRGTRVEVFLPRCVFPEAPLVTTCPTTEAATRELIRAGVAGADEPSA